MEEFRNIKTDTGIKSIIVDGVEVTGWTFVIEMSLDTDPDGIVGVFHPDEVDKLFFDRGYSLHVRSPKARSESDPEKYKYDYRAIITEDDDSDDEPLTYTLRTGDTFVFPGNGREAQIVRRRRGEKQEA